MEVGEVRLMAWRAGETNWKQKDQVNGGECTPCKSSAYSSDAGCERENWAAIDRAEVLEGRLKTRTNKTGVCSAFLRNCLPG